MAQSCLTANGPRPGSTALTPLRAMPIPVQYMTATCFSVRRQAFLSHLPVISKWTGPAIKKMKTKNSLILIISLIALLSSVAPAFAVVHGNIPNKNPLQPIPVNIRPNISGNINATSAYNPIYQNLSDIPSPIQDDQVSPAAVNASPHQDNPAADSAGADTWHWLIIIMIITVSILFLGFRKLKRA